MSDTQKIVIPSTGKEYKIIQEAVTWSEAVSNSIVYGGNLAQFETDLEAQNFWDTFSSSVFYENLDQQVETSASDEGGTKYFWLGANDANTEGTWRWIQDFGDGAELSIDSSRWGDSDFDDNKDSLALALEDWKDSLNEQILGSAGQWNDLNSNANKLYYLVEGPFEDSAYPNVIYTNSITSETRTYEEMIAAGWIALSEENYGDRYQYPALYSNGIGGVRAALDMSEGDKVADWIVVSSDSESTSSSETTTSSTSGSSTSSTTSSASTSGNSSTSTESSSSTTSNESIDSSLVTYINTLTNETKTYEEMITAGWIALSEANYADKYQYPAIYSAGKISDNNGPIHAVLDMTEGDQVGDWIVSSSILTIGTTNNEYEVDSQGFSSIAASAPVTVTLYEVGEETTLAKIKDYDGNLHAGDNLEETSSSYKYQGMLDVNSDGVFEAIFTNKVSKRWVTAKVDSTTGLIDFNDNGAGGGTRVVGIYEDPLIAEGSNNGGFLSDGVTPAPANFGVSDEERYVEVNGETVDRLALNSQVRFQNDLDIDNLSAKHSGDYDSDGVSEVYWKTNDGTAYLRALMHDDGNIRYANYQSEDQMSSYLTAQGHTEIISDIV